MIDRDEGKTRFLDGMRVTLEHLDNLQNTLLASLIQLRQSIGWGKVCFGLKVQKSGDAKVTVGAGVAFDAQARPLIVANDSDVTVNFGAVQTLNVVVAYVLKSALPVNGIPTILLNDVKIETRADPPPYADLGVVCAQLLASDSGFDVVQKGDWYLAPLDHRHTGEFLDDSTRGFRFDGHPVGFGSPPFDSGFLTVGPGQELRMTHGLNTVDLLVQLQSRSADGTISCEGLGSSFWYDLLGPQEVRVKRTEAGGDLALRVVLWPFDSTGTAPVPPVANAGDAEIVEFGASFLLDGSRSTGFGGRKLIRYIWTQLA